VVPTGRDFLTSPLMRGRLFVNLRSELFPPSLSHCELL
jgi:hypothetical protein